jgi:hypothetical protein
MGFYSGKQAAGESPCKGKHLPPLQGEEMPGCAAGIRSVCRGCCCYLSPLMLMRGICMRAAAHAPRENHRPRVRRQHQYRTSCPATLPVEGAPAYSPHLREHPSNRPPNKPCRHGGLKEELHLAQSGMDRDHRAWTNQCSHDGQPKQDRIPFASAAALEMGRSTSNT